MNPWVRNIPWRREWLPTPLFSPGEFHGQRSLADYRPWGRKESDRTENEAHTLILQMRKLRPREAGRLSHRSVGWPEL